MSKLINANCLHFIGRQNYTNVLINRVLYQIQVTALLPFFLSILARRGCAEVAGWTLDRKIRVRFPANPHRVWALWWQGGKRRLRTSRCPCRDRLGTLKTPSCPWRGCPAAGQHLETGHLSRHYIAEISLNVTLNHNQQQQQLIILHLLLQLSKTMLWITVKLLLAIVMSIIFGPFKILPRSSKNCDCLTFRVLKYLLSTFLLYTPHCHLILSKQKCCLWSTGVSTESQNLTSVLHVRQDVLATRNMTRIDVGLARSFEKLLLSSWKTYLCNLMAWYINK